MSPLDHIHVVYIGTDAIELTSLRLKVVNHKNHHYVLPVRDRPLEIPCHFGLDWAGNVIEKMVQEEDHGAFWQALNRFPELWEIFAGNRFEKGKLPQPWSTRHGWRLWEPVITGKDISEANGTPCETLRDIVGTSCKLAPAHNEKTSIGKWLIEKFVQMSGALQEGQLRGVIFCGPMASPNHPLTEWLEPGLRAFQERGLKIEGNLMRPRAGGLWLCPDDRDPVAEGATIYGKRILERVPAYLDTMPQISILAQEEIGKATWYPLLKAEEVPGGKEHTDRIKKRFQLSSGKRHLHVYLYKGSVDEAPSPTQDCLDSSSVRSEHVSFCKARVVREVVRRLGSLEAVQNRASFYFQPLEACYANRFAEVLFAKPAREQSVTSESVRTLLRRAVFDFPSAPENDTLLDIEVRIRPASGLARIEIIPEDSSFLKRDRVMLNYSTMRPASKLPVRMRGWPPIEEIVVDPSDGVLLAGKSLAETLENTAPIDPEYISLADRIRDEVLKKSTLKKIGNLYLYLGAIDQEGCACTASGEEILSRIANKFESDFSILLSKGSRKNKVAELTLRFGLDLVVAIE